MELSGIVPLIFEKSNGSMYNLSSFQNHVELFVHGDEVPDPVTVQSESRANLESKLENDLFDMCLNKFISELNEEVAVMNDDLSDSVHSKQSKEALSFSYLLASFGILDKEGNTSRHRIIRSSDDCLIDFVLLVFNAAIASINGNMNVINPQTFDQL